MLGSVHHTWIDRYGAHSHGYLVLALALWLAVREWRTRPEPACAFWWRALPAMLVLVACALLSEALFIGSIRVGILPLLVLSVASVCLGREAAARLLLPVSFLYFALPVWEPLNAPLQRLTTQAAEILVRLAGVQVRVEGNYVHLSSGTFEIASGCSGLNYLVAALTSGALIALVRLRTLRSRVRMILAVTVAGLVANWIRVAALIVIGDATRMTHYLIQVEHFYFGWGVFVLCLIPAFLYARKLGADDEDGTASNAPADHRALAARLPDWLPLATAATPLVVGGIACALLAGPRVPGSASLRPAGQVVAEFSSGWRPAFPGAALQRLVHRDEGDREIEALVVEYARETAGAHALFHGNDLAGGDWRITGRDTVGLDVDGLRLVLVETQLTSDNRTRLLWHWYEIGGRNAWSKPTIVLDKLIGYFAGRRDASIIALRAECHADCGSAREALRRYVEACFRNRSPAAAESRSRS
jgi:exosortase